MYYSPYPYVLYANQYPQWVMANHSSSTQIPRQLAMPTNTSPFPPVNTHKFKTSAKEIQNIMQQAHLLVDKISVSEKFAHDLINAAQLSNKTEVDRLISSTGITITFDTKYTPDSIRINLTENGCCGLTVILNW
ncbi:MULTISPECIES: hypothetical protein [unclassified Viridibacillus]|uniref:hypothetical protein n=1 Tax=unclassified Viridibacillus TaxID=2617942 RepID=UPI00096E9874|nr:hypothetical protein [Viridibacillus sp. FSL H7-0596]OMC84439.1 hypothetical protein BK128_16235 [Viridibacillus sp. FSL H7-0596]